MWAQPPFRTEIKKKQTIACWEGMGIDIIKELQNAEENF